MAKTLAELDAEFHATHSSSPSMEEEQNSENAPEESRPALERQSSAPALTEILPEEHCEVTQPESAVKTRTLTELDELFRAQKKTAPERGLSSQSESQRQWRIFLAQTGCMMLIVYLLLTLVIGVTVVRGDSMQPSFYENDVALFWRLSRGYAQGDVVLFRSDASPDVLIKRVAACPGDVLEIDDDSGVAIVNDVILDEPYVFAGTHSRGGVSGPFVLGENEYFVLGDNRAVALDSRYPNVGAIPKGEILGKIIFMVRSGGA